MKEKTKKSSSALLTDKTVLVYILCGLIFTGCIFGRETLTTLGLSLYPILICLFLCSVIQCVILFKNSIRLNDKYLFPLVFLLPPFFILRQDFNVKINDFLANISLILAILKIFFVLDVFGFFLLFRSEKKNKLKRSHYIILSILLLIALFSGFGCQSIGCMVGYPLSITCAILFYLIFPTRNINLYFRNSIINFYKNIKNCRSNFSKKRLLILLFLFIILVLGFFAL